MHIRTATNLDQDAIQGVHLSAFPESEREQVSKLAVDLLSEVTTPPTFSLVAENEGGVVGHVSFSPVTLGDTEHHQGYILAPLAVRPDHQNRRIGTQLIECGMPRLVATGVAILFVYGDPEYYGRFGFSVDTAIRYIPPYRLQYPFGWQGVVLNEGSTGTASVNITCATALCDAALW